MTKPICDVLQFPQRQLQSGGVDGCHVEGERHAMAIFQSQLWAGLAGHKCPKIRANAYCGH